MRVDELRDMLRKLDCQALLLFGSDPDFEYVVGREMESAVLVYPRRGNPKVFINPLEFTEGIGFDCVKQKDVLGAAVNLVKRKKWDRVGINESKILLVQYRRLRQFRLKDVADELTKVRAVKTDEEVKRIKKSCMLTVQIFLKLIEELKRRSMKTEADILLFLKQQTVLAGANLAFEPIVASGNDSKNPHYQGKKQLQRGFLVVDFGVKLQGYCSDVTRTFFMGCPTRKERLQYDKVKSALEGAIAFLRMGLSEGLEGCDVDAYTREALGPDARFFIHATGHGVGLEVHEYPAISKRKGHKLEKGMVLAIEPGIYKRSGVRIEDDIFLGSDVEILTKDLTRDLICF